jgi:hypothetical protein
VPRINALIVPILIGAFGAQTLIAALFAAFSRFQRRTFLARSKSGQVITAISACALNTHFR